VALNAAAPSALSAGRDRGDGLLTALLDIMNVLQLSGVDV